MAEPPQKNKFKPKLKAKDHFYDPNNKDHINAKLSSDQWIRKFVENWIERKQLLEIKLHNGDIIIGFMRYNGVYNFILEVKQDSIPILIQWNAVACTTPLSNE